MNFMPTTPLAKLLIVDDEAAQMKALCNTLEDEGYATTGFTFAKDALSELRSQPFDLVLSDLGLPDGSGLDLMRRLRERHGLSGIALTGYGMDEDVRRSLEAGFTEHLVKPITFQRLEAAIERFFASPPAPAAREREGPPST